MKPLKYYQQKNSSAYLQINLNTLKDKISEDTVSKHDIQVVKNSKRPILKLKKKAEKDKQNINSLLELPNKSFKIRSFIKRTPENNLSNSVEQKCTFIFEKVQRLRNMKSFSNRIDFEVNLKDKNESVIEVYSKMREVLKKQRSLKCKLDSSAKVFIGEPITDSIGSKQQKLMTFSNFNTSKYNPLSNRIRYYLNKQYQSPSPILLIVSLQSLFLKQLKNQSLQYIFEQQCMQFLMRLCRNEQLKIAWKVNNLKEYQVLNQMFKKYAIRNYYCIFYVEQKYYSKWNLYCIDQIRKESQRIIIVQQRDRLIYSFPILNNTSTIFFTYSQYKEFLQIINLTTELHASNFNQEFQHLPTIQTNESHPQIQSLFYPKEYKLKEERVHLNVSELNQKLKIAKHSKERKLNKLKQIHHLNKTTQSQLDVKQNKFKQLTHNQPIQLQLNQNNHLFLSNQKTTVKSIENKQLNEFDLLNSGNWGNKKQVIMNLFKNNELISNQIRQFRMRWKETNLIQSSCIQYSNQFQIVLTQLQSI